MTEREAGRHEKLGKSKIRIAGVVVGSKPNDTI